MPALCLDHGSMTTKNIIILLGLILLASCKNTQNNTETNNTSNKTVVLTDSSRAKLKSALEDVITSNSSSDDITIDAKFVNQMYDNGNSYITVKTGDESSITLTNPMPLDETDISKLKKEGGNITLTYSASNKTVKFLAVNYEPEK